MTSKEQTVYKRPELTTAQKIKYSCLVYTVCGFGSALSGIIFLSEKIKKLRVRE